MSEQPVISQVALSCVDLVLTEQWFREGIGLIPDGGKTLHAGTPFVDKLLDEPDAQAICWWMVGDNPGVRLALVQFAHPLPRLLPADHLPSDPGYSRIGFHVSDFDGALARLVALGSSPLAPVVGGPGDRRACVRSPDGLFVELMERDPLGKGGDVNVTLRSVTLSTPDLAASTRYFRLLTGADPLDTALHHDGDDALWGMDGANPQHTLFLSGELFLELAQYSAASVTAERLDRRLSDQGVISLRFSAPTRSAREAAMSRLSVRSIPLAGLPAFLREPSGAAVELDQALADEVSRGESPGSDRPKPGLHRVFETVTINAPLAAVWAALNDHDRMHDWIEADEFHIVRHGSPDSAGYGAERLLVTMGRRVGQQVTLVRDGVIGYRAISGTPFSYHNGAIYAVDTGKGVKLDWTIRFRTRDAALGEQVYPQLRAGIAHMLNIFKDMVEGVA